MPLSRAALATGTLVVAALFLGATINARLPDPGAIYSAPFTRPGTVGEPVTLRNQRVTVTGVDAGTELAHGRTVAVSDAHFLVVDLTYEPLGETGSLPAGWLRLRASDGRLFGGSLPVPALCGPTQPGMPIACRIPFEVSADALPGAALLVPAQGDTDAMDDVAVIDLAITAEDADRLAAASGRLTVADPSPVGR